jgi:hypothetical protein
MATIATKAVTLLDWQKRIDPNGRVARIIELLNQTNEVLEDMPFMEGNLPTGHQTTVRTGLPTVYWRLLNKGVPTSKSTTTQVTDATGILEARSNVDIDVAKLNGNVSEFRLSEARPYIESMNQKMAETVIYGNYSTSPESFNGLAVRYSDLTTAASKHNIIDAGGTGSDNTSILYVVWGDETAHGIFPKGSEVGLLHEDLGIQDVRDSDGNDLRVYKDWFQWKAGIVVKDWRYVVRIANIDVSDLVGESSAADIIKNLIKAEHRIPNINFGKAAIYMNRTVYQMLDIQARSAVQTGGQLGYSVVNGKRILDFRGVPIRKVDKILNTEARIT